MALPYKLCLEGHRKVSGGLAEPGLTPPHLSRMSLNSGPWLAEIWDTSLYGASFLKLRLILSVLGGRNVSEQNFLLPLE